MTDDKLYTSLSANTIMAKLTNHVLTDQLYNIIDWQILFTWLWRWLPLRLSKRQSPTTVLFRTTLTQRITQYEVVLYLLFIQYFSIQKVIRYQFCKSCCWNLQRHVPREGKVQSVCFCLNYCDASSPKNDGCFECVGLSWVMYDIIQIRKIF